MKGTDFVSRADALHVPGDLYVFKPVHAVDDSDRQVMLTIADGGLRKNVPSCELSYEIKQNLFVVLEQQPVSWSDDDNLSCEPIVDDRCLLGTHGHDEQA